MTAKMSNSRIDGRRVFTQAWPQRYRQHKLFTGRVSQQFTPTASEIRQLIKIAYFI